MTQLTLEQVTYQINLECEILGRVANEYTRRKARERLAELRATRAQLLTPSPMHMLGRQLTAILSFIRRQGFHLNDVSVVEVLPRTKWGEAVCEVVWSEGAHQWRANNYSL
jgi:hypothetical protein